MSLFQEVNVTFTLFSVVIYQNYHQNLNLVVKFYLKKIALGNEDLTDVEPIQSRYELYLAYIIQNGIFTGDDGDDYLLTESGLYLLDQLNEKIKLEELTEV